MKNRPAVFCLALAVAATTLCAVGDCVWKGNSGNWSNSENWTGGVPTSTDIASFPKSSTGYTVTVDCAAVCKYLRHENGTGSGKVVFTAVDGGSLACSGDAAGPSVSGYLSSNTKVEFTNITAWLGGFNPSNGNLIIEKGADINISTLYMNGTSSTLTVNDGTLYVGGFSIRTVCTFNFNGGTISLPRMNCQYGNVDRAVVYRQKGGNVTVRSTPVNFSNAIIDITGGSLKWPAGADFSAIDYAAWLPKAGGSLILPRPCYTALTTEKAPDWTVSLDGAIYVTNNLEACTTENAVSTPGIYAYTNTTFTGNGELYANYIYLRGTCTVDIAKLCLGHRVHFTNSRCVLLVPHGLTFGAYGNWYSEYNDALSYFYGPITVDTTDCFDGITPRTIRFANTVLGSDVDYVVKGTGTNRFSAGTTPMPISSLTVEDGATFEFLGGHGNLGLAKIAPDVLSVGAGASLIFNGKKSYITPREFDIDPTAQIVLNVPSDISAGSLYPILVDDSLSNHLDRVTVTGDGAAGWSAKSVAGTIYLTDGNPTAHNYGTSGLPYGWGWTGLSGGNFSDGGNWSGGTGLTSSTANSVENSSSHTLYFGRAAQNVVTNDISDSSYDNGVAACNMHFLPSAGPYEVHGNTISLYSLAWSNEHSPIASESSSPVVFYAPVRRTSGTFGMNVSGGSYLQFMGEVKSSSAYLFEKGDVRFGNKATFSGLFFGVANTGNPDVVTVLDSGRLYISSYNYALRAEGYAATSATLSVRKGGTFACGGIWAGGNTTRVRCGVDGYFAVSNTLYSMKNVPFSGSGTVYLKGVAPSNATVQAQFSGGLTLKMGGDWQAVSARCPNTPFTLAVKSGNLALVAAANWSYGIPSGVASATASADRAIAVAEGATLTFAASDFTTTLRDPVVGTGTVVFEEGCRMAFGGDLLASMNPHGGGWTTFATASAITGTPGLSDSYQLRTEDNGDGTFSMQARLRLGTLFIVR